MVIGAARAYHSFARAAFAPFRLSLLAFAAQLSRLGARASDLKFRRSFSFNGGIGYVSSAACT